jgi:hypothetical protein
MDFRRVLVAANSPSGPSGHIPCASTWSGRRRPVCYTEGVSDGYVEAHPRSDEDATSTVLVESVGVDEQSEVQGTREGTEVRTSCC